MSIEIEKGLEIPKAKTGRKRNFPIIETLEVDESVFIPRGDEQKLIDLFNKVSQCIHNYKRTVGLTRRFKVRTFKEDDGVRVWRTK